MSKSYKITGKPETTDNLSNQVEIFKLLTKLKFV
jgi:hypothetical protein